MCRESRGRWEPELVQDPVLEWDTVDRAEGRFSRVSEGRIEGGLWD